MDLNVDDCTQKMWKRRF